VPLKPAAALPGLAPIPNPKSGTTIVKSAPPKETARITVKPSLPPTATKAAGAGNLPAAKPVAGATVPVAAAAAGAVAGAAAVKATAPKAAKPATTIVKTPATPKVAAATIKPSTAGASVPVAPLPAQYQDEASTTLTTALAGVLAVLTWGTAGVLFASLYGLL
jgi:hypothetical protein